MRTPRVLEAHWGGGAAPFGASWQKTMMWIFIVTDGLLFSGLLCGYGFLRMASPLPWPNRTEVFSIPFIALMTFILITSSATMGTAVTASRLGDRKKATLRFLILTIVGGAAFLGCQAYEWTHLIHEGARLTDATPGAAPQLRRRRSSCSPASTARHVLSGARHPDHHRDPHRDGQDARRRASRWPASTGTSWTSSGSSSSRCSTCC